MVEEPEAPEDREVLVEPNETARPEGMEYAERVTVPEKPFRLDRVMLEERDVPAGINKSMGLREIPKPGPTRSTVTEAYSDKLPLVPVMTTV